MCNVNGMRRLRRHTLWLCLIVFIGVGALAVTAYGAPKCTGPLNIHHPIYAGTKVIGYKDGTAGCPIYVYADGQLVGKGARVTPVGQGVVYLSRALKEGETITAKQDPTGYTTWLKNAPTVKKIPAALLIKGEKFKPPTIMPPTVACQRGVRVEDLVEGVRASVSGGLVFPPKVGTSGSTWTPYQSTFVGVEGPLWEGDELVSYQDMDAKFPVQSDYSTPPKRVQALPKELQSPRIVEDVGNDGVLDVVVGSNVVHVCNQWIGAIVTVYAVDKTNTWRKVGGGLATHPCNWGYVEPLKKGLKYCVRQSLCRLQSPKQEQCVFTTNSINIPEIREPLCDGDIEVIVDKTVIGSTVWMQVNGNDRGNASAPGSTTVIPVSGGVPLKEGNRVRVKQNNASLDSGWGKWIRVESKTGPRCEQRDGTTPPPTPPAQPICKPGTDEATLWRDQSQCQAGLVHAYQGDIQGVQGAVLQKIINKSSDFRIKIVKEFNPKNPTGSNSVSCKSFGPKCHNTQVIATIQPNSSWSNINKSCWPFYRIYACLEPVKTGVTFPLTFDIDYEYTCK